MEKLNNSDSDTESLLSDNNDLLFGFLFPKPTRPG